MVVVMEAPASAHRPHRPVGRVARVARVARGDPDAIQALVSAKLPRMMALAGRLLGDPVEAELAHLTDATARPSEVTSSSRTTVSTPSGRTAPVRVRSARPGGTAPPKGAPAAARPSASGSLAGHSATLPWAKP